MHARSYLWVIVLAAAGHPGLPTAQAQDPAAFFKQNCMSCHTIGGGRLVGPDLKNVTQRQDKPWLTRFMINPQAVIASGDAYAKSLLSEAGGVVMPPVPGLNESIAQALLDLIEAESKNENSPFKGVQVSDRPYLPADIEQGRALFTGEVRLKNNGPACISCHALPNAAVLGGGALGPDLTKAYERLGGRKGLSSWLSAPATPFMQAVFSSRALDSQEIQSIVACLEDAARTSPAVAASEGSFGFMTIGVAAAIAGLMLVNRIWRGRLRGVRESLLQPGHTQGAR